MNISPALGVAIVLATAIVIVLAQNLGTVVQISFLGFTSLPLPLSLAMLFAFLSGGAAAALWNQLALWMTDRLEKPDNKQTQKEEDLEEEEEEYYEEEEDEDDILEIEYIDR